MRAGLKANASTLSLKNRKINKYDTILKRQATNVKIFIGTVKRTDKYFEIYFIAYVLKGKDKHIKIKIAISLNKLLVKYRQAQMGKADLKDNQASYNQIALNADLRKATVSDIFNAKSTPSSSTLILVVQAMGFSLTDFAQTFDSVNDFEILSFKMNL